MLILCCSECKSRLTAVMVKEWHAVVEREMVSVSADMAHRPTCASNHLGDIGETATPSGLLYTCRMSALCWMK